MHSVSSRSRASGAPLPAGSRFCWSRGPCRGSPARSSSPSPARRLRRRGEPAAPGSSIGVLSAAVGPVVGGALTQAFSWRAIFVAQVAGSAHRGRAVEDMVRRAAARGPAAAAEGAPDSRARTRLRRADGAPFRRRPAARRRLGDAPALGRARGDARADRGARGLPRARRRADAGRLGLRADRRRHRRARVSADEQRRAGSSSPSASRGSAWAWR